MQVFIGGSTNFSTEMNNLRMNPNLEHQKVHTKKKTSAIAKVGDASLWNVCEDVI